MREAEKRKKGRYFKDRNMLRTHYQGSLYNHTLFIPLSHLQVIFSMMEAYLVAVIISCTPPTRFYSKTNFRKFSLCLNNCSVKTLYVYDICK